MAGPLTHLIPGSQLRRSVRIYGNRRSTVKGAHSIHKSLSAMLHTGAMGRQPIQDTKVVLLVGWQLPTG
jgi:hypothetical protein